MVLHGHEDIGDRVGPTIDREVACICGRLDRLASMATMKRRAALRGRGRRGMATDDVDRHVESVLAEIRGRIWEMVLGDQEEGTLR